MNTPQQQWDAGLYDDKHAFVWQYGAAVVELLDPQKGERILDLGCGTGRLTARIAEAGAKVVGMDSSAEMLAQARSAFPHLEWVQGDARDFAFSDPYDAIFSNAALHWIREPGRVIRCVHDALRPGGRFVAELGGRGNVGRIEAAMGLAAERLGVRLGGSPMYFPAVGDYATLLDAAGLEVRSAALFDRPTPLEGETGLRDWIRMFGQWALISVPEDRREDFLRTAEDAARPQLFRDGRWFADYRRLRITAIRVHDSKPGIGS